MENNFDIASIPVQTLILLTLKSGDKYGYEIKDGIEKLTNNQIEIKQANLYSSLKKLEQIKLISSYWRDSDIGGKRHYYFLTDSGKEELNKSDIEKILSEELSKKSKQEDLNKSVEYFDKDAAIKSGGFFASQGINSSQPVVSEVEVEDLQTTTPLSSIEDIVPSANSINNKKLESNDLTPEVVSADVINKKSIQPLQTSKQIKEEELPRIESDDVVSKAKSQAQMQNTDIDYKNILGELYSPDNGCLTNDVDISNNATDLPDDLQNSVVDKEEISNASLPISQNISKKIEVTTNSNVEKNERYIDKIINKSVKVSNYSNFGINVKRHSKASEILTNDNFHKISSLRFMESIFVYLLIVLEICVAYLFVRNGGSVLYSDFSIFAIIGAIFVLYPICCLTIYLINPNKKKKVEINFTNSLVYRILATFIFIMFVIAMNFLFGMTNLNQADYIIFWLLPSLLSLNLVFELLVFKLLLMSGKYNC